MEWKTVKLGDCLSKIIDNRGKTPKDLAASGHPLLEINAVSKNNKYPLYGEAKKYVDDVVYSTWFRSGHPQYGDILVPTVGTLGAVAYVDRNDCCIAQNLIALRANADICDSAYIYYLLCNPQIVKRLLNLDIGAVQASIKVPHLLALEISLPPLETQHRIAAILSSLDDKIENNNRINANLEAQAQALFKSWFVNFEPFGGVMPEDWREGTLEDIIANIESGSRPQGGAEAYGIPSVGAEKIERFGYYEYASEKYVNNEYFAKMKRGHVKDGDVLLYKDGAYTGKTSMALDGFPYETCAVNEHVFLLRTESSKHQFFLYFLMSYPDIRKMIHTLASAKAAQPGLNQSEVLGVDIIVPSKDKIEEFNRLVAPSMHLIAAKAKESHRLAALRDTLLPKLMRGEITL